MDALARDVELYSDAYQYERAQRLDVSESCVHAALKRIRISHPKHPKKCVIVMDNARFHKREDIEQAIIDAGHILEYLPAYSPDLNPIEHKWAQAKAVRCRCHCSVEEIFQ